MLVQFGIFNYKKLLAGDAARAWRKPRCPLLNYSALLPWTDGHGTATGEQRALRKELTFLSVTDERCVPLTSAGQQRNSWASLPVPPALAARGTEQHKQLRISHGTALTLQHLWDLPPHHTRGAALPHGNIQHWETAGWWKIPVWGRWRGKGDKPHPPAQVGASPLRRLRQQICTRWSPRRRPRIRPPARQPPWLAQTPFCPWGWLCWGSLCPVCTHKHGLRVRGAQHRKNVTGIMTVTGTGTGPSLAHPLQTPCNVSATF